jgi:hypothetical protein
MRFDAKQSRRIGKHWPRVRLRNPLTFEHFEKHLGVTAAHVGVGLTFSRGIAEISPPIDYLFR